MDHGFQKNTGITLLLASFGAATQLAPSDAWYASLLWLGCGVGGFVGLVLLWPSLKEHVYPDFSDDPASANEHKLDRSLVMNLRAAVFQLRRSMGGPVQPPLSQLIAEYQEYESARGLLYGASPDLEGHLNLLWYAAGEVIQRHQLIAVHGNDPGRDRKLVEAIGKVSEQARIILEKTAWAAHQG
jgi:hypothetical protein